MKSNFEQWAIITIMLYPEGRGNSDNRVLLKRVDMPREIFKRRPWYSGWIYAREVCKNPKGCIEISWCFYEPDDKRSDLDKLKQEISSARGQVTKMENKIKEYKKWAVQQSLFYVPEQDILLQKAEKKLLEKKSKLVFLQNKLNNVQSTT